jgi:hypothetical protein
MTDPLTPNSYCQESRQEWIDGVKAFPLTADENEEHLRRGWWRLVLCALLQSVNVPREPVEPEYRTLFLVGKCPACGHEMDKVVQRRHPKDVPPWDGRVLVYCNCAASHPDQPPGRTGCGNYGWLTMDLLRDPWVPRASIARPDDLRWELQAEELHANRLADTRATAQKWAAAITSITGVFGIVAVIKGPSSIHALSSPGRYIVYSLAGVAVLLALMAIGLASAASEGTPRLGHLSGSEARFWESWQATAAMHELKLSRAFAYVAVLVLLAAILITWVGTP